MSSLVLLHSLALFLALPAQAINYFRCDQTQDCIKAYGGCGRYLSVHRRYKELYEAKAHKGDQVAFCLKPEEIDKKYKMQGQPLCQKNRCLLVLKSDEKSTKKN